MGVKREWYDTYYTVSGSGVHLYHNGTGLDCIDGTGPTAVVKGLESKAVTGRAQLLVERLPAAIAAPAPLQDPIPDRYVHVRGIPIQPFCSPGYVFWISHYRFLGRYKWSGNHFV